MKEAGHHVARLKRDFLGQNAREMHERWNTLMQQRRPWTGKRGGKQWKQHKTSANRKKQEKTMSKTEVIKRQKEKK